MDKEKLIRPAEFAKIHNVTRQTVYNWIKTKKVASKKIENYQFVVIPIK